MLTITSDILKFSITSYGIHFLTPQRISSGLPFLVPSGLFGCQVNSIPLTISSKSFPR